MTRLEENIMIIKELEAKAEQTPSGTYKEVVVINLGVIASMLVDISKSLAIIANKVESEEV